MIFGPKKSGEVSTRGSNVERRLDHYSKLPLGKHDAVKVVPQLLELTPIVSQQVEASTTHPRVFRY